MSSLKCPECKASDVRVVSGQCATCRLCSKIKRRVYRFCWACQREWPSINLSEEACKQPDCAVRAALLSSRRIEIQSSVVGCPFFRACPGCKMLLTHKGLGCPSIICPKCDTEFCFRCLEEECFEDCTIVENSVSL